MLNWKVGTSSLFPWATNVVHLEQHSRKGGGSSESRQLCCYGLLVGIPMKQGLHKHSCRHAVTSRKRTAGQVLQHSLAQNTGQGPMGRKQGLGFASCDNGLRLFLKL